MNIFIYSIVKFKTVANCLNQLEHYNHLINSRRALAKLDDSMLKDIGLTRAEAENEAEKPFWKNESFMSVNKKNKSPLKQTQVFTRKHSSKLKI